MIKMIYKIFQSMVEIAGPQELKGDLGYFELRVGEHSYGDIPELIDLELSTTYIDYWFEELGNALILLRHNPEVFVSDLESYNSWIKFENKDQIVKVSLIHSYKIDSFKQHLGPQASGLIEVTYDEKLNQYTGRFYTNAQLEERKRKFIERYGAVHRETRVSWVKNVMTKLQRPIEEVVWEETVKKEQLYAEYVGKCAAYITELKALNAPEDRRIKRLEKILNTVKAQ